MPYTIPGFYFFSDEEEDYFDEAEIEGLELELDEDDDDDDDDDEDEDYVPPPNPNSNPARRIIFEEEVAEEMVSLPQTTNNLVVELDDQRREEGEAISSSSSRRIEGEGSQSREESNGNENEGVCCSICLDCWSSEGRHQVCCLPCGHVYGFSCIEKWIRQCRRNPAKCPQCGRNCGVKDIIKLYVPRIAVVDGELQKKVLSLQAENEFLRMKASCLENAPFKEMRRGTSDSITWAGDSQGQRLSGHTLGSVYGGHGSSSCSFALQDELMVDGARIFDIDASNRILILARRLPGMGGNHVLTKISLMYPYESENIQLPLSTKAVKDLHVSPSAGRLALFASLGKKVSVLSMESNNIVLTYELPGPAWSCSWDLNSPHHLYAGLQNGMLLVFDMRQTARPMESINGLTSHLVHTIHSLVHTSPTPCGFSTLISASSIGPCVWNTGGAGERPFLVPEMENQGVCISLAYCPSTDDIVASFRPKVQTSNDILSSQPSLSPSPTVLGHGILGSHVLIKRVGESCYQNLGSTSANVNDVRMLKSTIVNKENCNPLFAFGDELTCGLSLRELPSLRVIQSLKAHQHPILDVKYAPSLGSGILGCISEDRLQLFSANLS